MDIVHFSLLVSFLSVTYARVTLYIYLKSRNNEREKQKNKDIRYPLFWCWLNIPSKVVSVSVCLQKETTLFLFYGWQTKPSCLYEAPFLSRKPLVFLHFPMRLDLLHPLRTVLNGYASPGLHHDLTHSRCWSTPQSERKRQTFGREPHQEGFPSSVNKLRTLTVARKWIPGRQNFVRASPLTVLWEAVGCQKQEAHWTGSSQLRRNLCRQASEWGNPVHLAVT